MTNKRNTAITTSDISPVPDSPVLGRAGHWFVSIRTCNAAFANAELPNSAQIEAFTCQKLQSALRFERFSTRLLDPQRIFLFLRHRITICAENRKTYTSVARSAARFLILTPKSYDLRCKSKNLHIGGSIRSAIFSSYPKFAVKDASYQEKISIKNQIRRSLYLIG